MNHWLLPVTALAAGIAIAAGDARVEAFTQRVNEYVKTREAAEGKATPAGKRNPERPCPSSA